MNRLSTPLVALACAISGCGAWAQQGYPSKPIRLIVPLAAGGAMDTVARGAAIRLTESLKQTVVVDNRSGAAGSIGAELTAHAAPRATVSMAPPAASGTMRRIGFDG